MISDRRTDDEKKRTTAYIVGTDKFLSGWGLAAGGKSYYALAILDHSEEQARLLIYQIFEHISGLTCVGVAS